MRRFGVLLGAIASDRSSSSTHSPAAAQRRVLLESANHRSRVMIECIGHLGGGGDMIMALLSVIVDFTSRTSKRAQRRRSRAVAHRTGRGQSNVVACAGAAPLLRGRELYADHSLSLRFFEASFLLFSRQVRQRRWRQLDNAEFSLSWTRRRAVDGNGLQLRDSGSAAVLGSVCV